MTPESDRSTSIVAALTDVPKVPATSTTVEPTPADGVAKVFAATAQSLVPLVCDGYTLLLEREGMGAIRLDGVVVAQDTVTAVEVPIVGGDADRGRKYSGTLTLHLSDRHSETESGLAGRLAVELAISILERERLRSKVANLELALESNREIGAAIGVLMMTYKCTPDQAFDKLREASQHSHRKLAAIAQDVTRTGLLDGAPSDKGYLTTRTPCMLS